MIAVDLQSVTRTFSFACAAGMLPLLPAHKKPAVM
jgi:hypothetical protein